MFGRVLLAGALIVLSAAGNLAVTGLNIAADAVFIAALIIYMVAYRKARKLFID